MTHWLLTTVLPWIISAITVSQVLMAGNKHRHSWTVGLANQMLWLIWIVADEKWGFLPLNIALWIAYYRNHVKWRRET